MSYVFFGLAGRQAACAAVYMQTRKSKQRILAFVSEMCLNLQFKKECKYALFGHRLNMRTSIIEV
jgi:hypothetical protein